MTLQEAIDKRLGLVVHTPLGGERYAAEVFLLPKALAYFDIGWINNDTHGFHVVLGEPEGDGPWMVGDAIVRVVSDQDDAAWDMVKWEAYRRSPEGAEATRERAREVLRAAIGE